MITIPITFCMLIAKYLCLLKPFWLRKNNKTSVLLIIIILAMILGVVKIQVWLNDWNNDFFNALSQKETDKLWQLVLWFPALLGIFVLISVNKTWLIKLLTIRWREWLTDYYLNRWFADKNYYFTQIYGEHKNTDNPDQRIAEDILLLISKTLSLSFGFIQSLSMLITFTVILWQSAGTLSFTVGGTEWNIQGYMVYTVVLIVIGGTLFTHKVGKRIRPLNVEKQRSEATFRTNLVQHNKQAELIALSNAESLQRQELSENFHTIKENWHRLMNRQRWLDYWQNIYSRSLSVLPYFLLLPQFISGQINLGGLMKSRQAFMLVSNNLSWFIYKYDELAELAAVIDRLYEFHQLTEQRPTNKPKNCQHAVQVADASIRTPDNFEEMTVYAPVPVPVNGNTHYTSESIERLPTGNGNISDLLRTNPAVRMDSTQSTSLNQGDIRPEKISIHGASPYQNAYLIDGISATNNLNPANESDASSATNISGMSQGYYLDVSLLDNVTLYDSFVPVEFGRFNGGVIDAKIKRFNADDSSVKLGYRTTRSDWLTSHIDENNKSAFNQGSSGSTYYSPDFKKNFYTLSFNQELADNFGVTAGLSRRQSDITRADYVSNDGIVAGRAQYKNVIDTALSKFTWFASDRFTHDLTLKYTGSSRDYNTSTFPQSDREMGNKSYGLAWDMDTQLAWAKLRTTVGWDHISDYTRHDHDIWYTELSCTYGDITGRCTRGGLGHISQAVDNYTFKTRLDWQKFTVGNVSHQPYFGAEYIYSDAWTERHNQSESYVINAAGKKTNHTIYHKGKGSLGIDNYTLYMADRISWRNVSLMPGVRYDYDNYLSNHNISPRFMTEWDIFADQTSMITAGYNRYYGGNILDMGLRDIRNSWTESVSGNKTLTRYQDLKTPYNDELAMGLQQKISKNVIARANYVYREAHDQISKSSRTDSATKTTITEYNNDGKTKTHSFNLSFELAEPLHISQVDINPQIVFSYIKSKGNLSLNNGYEESNTGDNQVVYNGNLVSYDSVPVADFNNPLKISLNMDFTHQPSGLVWANTLTWQEARKARIILGKTNAQYISEYSDYKQYVDEKLDSSLTWDTRLSWTPQFLKQQNLTFSADILNVLDSKTAVDTTNTGVATYASGRTFWLDVSMKF
ncbi:SbmA/BacA-like family transporter [Escherichia coli]